MSKSTQSHNATIFLSCVSREFHRPSGPNAKPWEGSYRNELDDRLQRCGLSTIVQEKFSQGGGDLLSKLDAEVKRADAVIHLIGNASGDIAKNDEVARLLSRHPEFLSERPELQKALRETGFKGISYTQWEALLAIHHDVKLAIFEMDASAPRAPGFVASEAEASLQVDHFNRVRETGHDRDPALKTLQAVCDRTIEFLVKNQVIGSAPHPLRQNLPYRSLGTLFKGRKEFMQKIRRSLLGNSSNATAITAAQAIHGAGGIGKTRAAVEYAWEHQADYTALLFVQADTPATLNKNIAALAGLLKVTLPANATEQDALSVVFAWLGQHPGWLLILDNADTPGVRSAIAKRLASLSSGHVLITTRLRDWPAGEIECLQLDLLTLADAVDFLLDDQNSRRKRAPDDDDRAKDVATALGCLSLGLTQARAFVSQGRTYNEYLRRYQENDAEVVNWFDKDLCRYPREVATAWQTSVKQLTPAAKRLLDVLSYFAPDPIPDDLMDSIPSELVHGILHPRDALLELSSLSLLERDPREATFTVHRLIQDVTGRRAKLNPQQHDFIRQWLEAAFDGDIHDPERWPRWKALAPHVLAFAHHKDTPNLLAARALGAVAVRYRAWGMPAAAEPLLRQAIATCERLKGSDNSETLLLVDSLSKVVDDLGHGRVAELLARQVLRGRERTLGSEHRHTLASLATVAGQVARRGDLVEAEALMRRALEAAERTLGASTTETLTICEALGNLLARQGDVAAAEPLIRRAVLGNEQLFGHDHLTTLRSIGSLASLLSDKGDDQAALAMCRRVFDAETRLLGPTHRSTLGSGNSLALALARTGDNAAAEKIYRDEMQVCVQDMGEDHPNTMILMHNLASLLSNTGNAAEALTISRRVLESCERRLGPDHPDTVSSIEHVAGALHGLGRHLEAELLLRRHVATTTQLYGPQHRETLDSLSTLGVLLRDHGDLAEATTILGRVLEGRELLLGPDHPDTLLSVSHVARLCHEKHDPSAAEPLILRAVIGFARMCNRTGRVDDRLFRCAERWWLILRDLNVDATERIRRFAELDLSDLYEVITSKHAA